MNEPLIKKLLSLPDIHLTAVTKKHTKEEVDQLHALGVQTFGENRVQELLEKYDPAYDWHLIGHLQTNKVKYIIGKVSLIESVDSEKLLDEIEKQAAKAGLVQDILIEVKVAQDASKTGLDESQLESLLAKAANSPHIRTKGLMTIGTLTQNRDQTRKEFRHLKSLFDKYRQQYPTMDTLSMGMSQDWPIAIEEGATSLRIGTALFAK